MLLRRRPDKHEYFLKMLELVASRGTCRRRYVAAIITDRDGHILSTGYNGPPAPLNHCIAIACPGATDEPGNTDRCEAVHAEINALLQCTRPEVAHRMYVSCTPCFSCAKAIANTKIQQVYCAEPYADQRGKDILERAGIHVHDAVRVV